jgi:hypothetical protein
MRLKKDKITFIMEHYLDDVHEKIMLSPKIEEYQLPISASQYV